MMASGPPNDDILPGGLIDATDPAVRAQLEADLQALRSCELSGDQLCHVLHDFGEAGFLKARLDIEACLTHSDPIVRFNALTALVLDWALQEHRATAERFLRHDPDEDNRSLAATCLGTLREGKQDPGVLRLLSRVVRNDTE